MPPKKQKPNGFMIFMMDMKPRLESDGHSFPRGYLDVHPVCSPLWKNLTSEQKAVYNQRAKGSAAVREDSKLDSFGNPIIWKQKEEEQKAAVKSQIFQKIEDMVSYLSQQDQLEGHDFHLAHFNYAVETDEGEFPPCEVAVVKFSLLNGISKHYHQFIDPGKIRMGYSFLATEHSEKTHKIPVYGFKLFNSNYMSITSSIRDLLRQPDGGIAPLFFLDEDMKMANFILEWLIHKSYQSDASKESSIPFKTYSLNKLFYELRRHADLNDPRYKFTSTLQVADKLCSGMFDFYSNMACEWHEDQDNVKYCSLTRVRNYAYTISDLCCEEYGLKLLPNRHCPAVVADDDKYEVLPKVPKTERKVSDDSVSENGSEASEATPRLPRSFSKVVEQAVASRVAANFNGAGRGLLGVSIGSPEPGKTIQTPPPAGRGRGRGFLLNLE